MVIDLQDLKIDLDNFEIVINGKLIKTEEAKKITASYLCMRIYRLLTNNYITKLKELLGENCTSEEIFEVATKVQLLIARNNIDETEAVQQIFYDLEKV